MLVVILFIYENEVVLGERKRLCGNADDFGKKNSINNERYLCKTNYEKK